MANCRVLQLFQYIKLVLNVTQSRVPLSGQYHFIILYGNHIVENLVEIFAQGQCIMLKYKID